MEFNEVVYMCFHGTAAGFHGAVIGYHGTDNHENVDDIVVKTFNGMADQVKDPVALPWEHQCRV